MPALYIQIDQKETFNAVQGLNTLIFQKKHFRGQMAMHLKDNPKEFEKTIAPIDALISELETLKNKFIEHWKSCL